MSTVNNRRTPLLSDFTGGITFTDLGALSLSLVAAYAIVSDVETTSSTNSVFKTTGNIQKN